MEFEKYQHIERIGTIETNGIEFGTCFIFPKIDGTNGQLWITAGVLRAGSRNRELSLDNDNQGFMAWAVKQDNIIDFLKAHPELRIYGEWLVPHTLKTYQENAWRKFYIFDVMSGENYLPYETYKSMLDEYNLEYIPPICKTENPIFDRLIELLDKNTYLIKDGGGVGEGIVIKNYNYKNKFGRVTWAKLVRNEFKTSHAKVGDVNELKDKKMVEQEIVNKYVTSALIEKEYAKIETESGWTSKNIPQLLNTVYYCLVKEESWNYVKEHKNPVIDYGRLMHFTIAKIKEIKKELF